MAPVVLTQPPRVAIISDSKECCSALKSFLESVGLVVVLTRALMQANSEDLTSDGTDIIVIDLDDDLEHELGFLDDLLESALPVLFNYGAASRSYLTEIDDVWARNFVGKLMQLADTARPRSPANDETQQAQGETGRSETCHERAMSLTDTPADAQVFVRKSVPGPELGSSSERIDPNGATQFAAPPSAATHVWVLGASIGGPQSVKRFIKAVPGDLPVAFILAQHIGDGFIELLGRQLDRATEFTVMPAVAGHLLQHREIVITPVDKRIVVNDNGEIVLRPAHCDSLYTPSIDAVLMDTAARYGDRAGAIIFSGMGTDGAEGSRAITARGGVVWAQDPGSCVVSSMPDAVRLSGTASFSGTPEELGRNLAARFEGYCQCAVP